MLYLAVAIAGFALASYSDLRTREVPPWLSYGLIGTGFAMHALESFILSDPYPLLITTLMTGACFIFAYLLYTLGAWAGGDVKLFTALGALLPEYGVVFFPFLVFGLSIMMVLPFAIIYVIYFLTRQEKLRAIITQAYREWLPRGIYSCFALFSVYTLTSTAGLEAYSIIIFIVLVVALYRLFPYGAPIITFVATFSLLKQPDMIVHLLYFFMLSTLFFLGIASFGVARKHILREVVSIAQLKEGMIPAVDVFAQKGKAVLTEPRFGVFPKNTVANSHRAGGLTAEEIQKLRKLGLRKLPVKKSMPFVPVMLLGIMVSAFAVSVGALSMFLY
jgi:preflagellin peptidase FlaK